MRKGRCLYILLLILKDWLVSEGRVPPEYGGQPPSTRSRGGMRLQILAWSQRGKGLHLQSMYVYTRQMAKTEKDT